MNAEDYGKCPDEILSRLARKGDEMALEQIFHQYRENIRGKANLYFMVGGEKEDMIQEGMIGLFWAIMNFDEAKGASFSTFAELCINRQMISAARRSGRLKHTPLNTSVSLNNSANDDDESPDSMEDTIADNRENTPEEVLMMNDDLERIFIAGVSSLSKLELEVWEEYVRGKTYTEIARSLGKSPKTIDNAIQRIKKKMLKTIAN